MVASFPVSAVKAGGLGPGNRQNSPKLSEAVRCADGRDKGGPRLVSTIQVKRLNREIHPATGQRSSSEAYEPTGSRDERHMRLAHRIQCRGNFVSTLLLYRILNNLIPSYEPIYFCLSPALSMLTLAQSSVHLNVFNPPPSLEHQLPRIIIDRSGYPPLKKNPGEPRGISTATPKSGAITAGIAPSAWRGLSGSAARLANLQDIFQFPDVDKTALEWNFAELQRRVGMVIILGIELGNRLFSAARAVRVSKYKSMVLSVVVWCTACRTETVYVPHSKMTDQTAHFCRQYASIREKAVVRRCRVLQHAATGFLGKRDPHQGYKDAIQYGSRSCQHELVQNLSTMELTPILQGNGANLTSQLARCIQDSIPLENSHARRSYVHAARSLHSLLSYSISTATKPSLRACQSNTCTDRDPAAILLDRAAILSSTVNCGQNANAVYNVFESRRSSRRRKRVLYR
ncbi:hypothetical protein SVAN01_03945 [Stagonosporopsis vannaccii]|nr:hypothetical protein SVAN01_03945 [Stagonosporopsis vannaccii]